MPATETVQEIQKKCDCGKVVFIVRDGVALLKCDCGREVPVVLAPQEVRKAS